jgi:hypothetical protein
MEVAAERPTVDNGSTAVGVVAGQSCTRASNTEEDVALIQAHMNEGNGPSFRVSTSPDPIVRDALKNWASHPIAAAIRQ